MILRALRPLTCNSTRPQHTLQMFTIAQDKLYHEKLLIRDCCNHKGSCTLFRPYLTIAAGISSSSFERVSTRQLAMSSLSKGISSTLNFHESIETVGTRIRILSHGERAPYRLSELDVQFTLKRDVILALCGRIVIAIQFYIHQILHYALLKSKLAQKVSPHQEKNAKLQKQKTQKNSV